MLQKVVIFWPLFGLFILYKSLENQVLTTNLLTKTFSFQQFTSLFLAFFWPFHFYFLNQKSF
jgi:di/tricarboxylate transporter